MMIGLLDQQRYQGVTDETRKLTKLGYNNIDSLKKLYRNIDKCLCCFRPSSTEI